MQSEDPFDQAQRHAAELQSQLNTTEQTTPHKVHIRGVDYLTTDDIKAFSLEHFPSDPPTRIEWIDDTSANIVYDTPATALKALDNMTRNTLGDAYATPFPPILLRVAKPFSTHPESTLQIRTALFSDQKRPRAHEASRFYMMHPEYDPREKRRRDRSHHSGNGDYNRRRYGKEEHRRRRKADEECGIDASMYDDNPSTSVAKEGGSDSRRGSKSTLSSEGELRSTRDRSEKMRTDRYRPGRRGRDGSRDRSASPGGPDSGRGSSTHQRKYNRRTPPPRYRSRDPNPYPRANNAKELFPSKSTSALDIGAELRGFPTAVNGKELFPNKKSAANLKKELFPQKSTANGHGHRRSDAFDAADETADLFASGMTVPFVDGTIDTSSKSRSLADRITDPSTSTFGRLKSSDPDPDPKSVENIENGGFNIRGTATPQTRGFSIRGIAADGTPNGSVKELFPGKKVGNAGKELFTEKIQGRGGKRNKAEDMFY